MEKYKSKMQRLENGEQAENDEFLSMFKKEALQNDPFLFYNELKAKNLVQSREAKNHE